MKTESIRKEIIVRASQARCFHMFTAGMGRWWPREHHNAASPLQAVVVESRAGGRWYSLCGQP